MIDLWKSEQFREVIDELANGIQWYFQPPSAPHFGGLWESSVKRVKTHIKRVIGSTILTFVEFSNPSRGMCKFTSINSVI